MKIDKNVIKSIDISDLNPQLIDENNIDSKIDDIVTIITNSQLSVEDDECDEVSPYQLELFKASTKGFLQPQAISPHTLYSNNKVLPNTSDNTVVIKDEYNGGINLSDLSREAFDDDVQRKVVIQAITISTLEPESPIIDALAPIVPIEIDLDNVIINSKIEFIRKTDRTASGKAKITDLPVDLHLDDTDIWGKNTTRLIVVPNNIPELYQEAPYDLEGEPTLPIVVNKEVDVIKLASNYIKPGTNTEPWLNHMDKNVNLSKVFFLVTKTVNSVTTTEHLMFDVSDIQGNIFQALSGVGNAESLQIQFRTNLSLLKTQSQYDGALSTILDGMTPDKVEMKINFTGEISLEAGTISMDSVKPTITKMWANGIEISPSSTVYTDTVTLLADLTFVGYEA